MLPDLNNSILSAWATTDLTETERLTVAMDRLVGGDLLTNAIFAILADATLLGEIAAQSFHHPTGASKVVLTQLGRDLPELRIHCWPKVVDRGGSEFSIHNHRWSFCSHVLMGSVEHELFEECASGVPHYGVEFCASGDKKIYDANNVGAVNISATECITLTEGDQYSLEDSRLHRMTNQREDLAVTLFLRTPYRSSSTMVLHERAQAIKSGEYPPRISPATVSDLLTKVAAGAEKNAS